MPSGTNSCAFVTDRFCLVAIALHATHRKNTPTRNVAQGTGCAPVLFCAQRIGFDDELQRFVSCLTLEQAVFHANR